MPWITQTPRSVRYPKTRATGSCSSWTGSYRRRRIKSCSRISTPCRQMVAVPTLRGVSRLTT